MEGVGISVHWIVECYGADGQLKWVEDYDNLVVGVGLRLMLDSTFSAVAGGANWFLGLKDTGTPLPANTMGSHAAWATLTPYSNATDPAWTKNGAATGDGPATMSNSVAKGVFNINATATIYGSFLKTDSTKGGTTGNLFGVGDFATPRPVISGDTLNVQVDLSNAAA
jgi:hypothetical protein